MYKKPLVYISHPSKGLKKNTTKIEKIIRELYSCHGIANNFCLVSPVHCYGFMYNDVDYETGLNFCKDLLSHCNVMLVFGDYTTSVGCNAEIEFCKHNNIPYMIMGTEKTVKEHLDDGLVSKVYTMSRLIN